MKAWIVLGLLLVFSLNVSAVSMGDILNVNCSTLTYQGQPLSEAKIPLPTDLANFLSGESVTVHMDDGTTFSGDVSKGVVSNITCFGNLHATMTMFISPSAVEAIANSSDPLKTLKQQMGQGQVTFHPQGIVAQGKMFLLSIILLFT